MLLVLPAPLVMLLELPVLLVMPLELLAMPQRLSLLQPVRVRVRVLAQGKAQAQVRVRVRALAQGKVQVQGKATTVVAERVVVACNPALGVTTEIAGFP